MRKFCMIITSLVLVLATAATAAFSKWLFTPEATDDKVTAVAMDDIKENYTFGDTKSDSTTYTMYLFPSTVYLDYYIKYLETKGTQAETRKPEELFGYIEPDLSVSGDLQYENVEIPEDGRADYRRVKYKTSYQSGDDGYLSLIGENSAAVSPIDTNYPYKYMYINANGVLNYEDLPEATKARYDAGEIYKVYSLEKYYRVGRRYQWWPATYEYFWEETNFSGEYEDYDYVYRTAYQEDGYWNDKEYDYGDYREDLKNKITYNNSYNGKINRNMHRYDRFGAWPTVDKGEGRWLPIKLNVDETFSAEFYNAAIRSPIADMGDPLNYYIYNFNHWAYLAATETGYTKPYWMSVNLPAVAGGTSALRSFYPTDTNARFDLTDSFEIYADENNVIRLFPRFSNGKGYDAESMQTGGSDVFRLNPTYADTDHLRPSELYFACRNKSRAEYKSASGNESAHAGLFIWQELDIDLYRSIELKMDYSPDKPANWTGNWQPLFMSTSGSILDSVQLNKIKNQYGGGLYNVYLFVLNICGSTNINWNSGGYSEIFEQFSHDVNFAVRYPNASAGETEDNKRFSSMIGKNLIAIDGYEDAINANGRQIFLRIEKVRQGRIVSDLEEPVGGVVTRELENDIQGKYKNNPTTFQAVSSTITYQFVGINSAETESEAENTAAGAAGADVAEAAAAISNDIGTTYPVRGHRYLYILQNVDLGKEGASNYFQIRFQHAYRYNLKFSLCSIGLSTIDENGNVTVGGNKNAHLRIIYGDAPAAGQPDTRRIFSEAEEYFELVDAEPAPGVNAEGENGDTDVQQFFKIKDDNHRGVYDFLMIFETNQTEEDGGTFYVYAYRHTNTFLKIFKEDVGSFTEGSGTEVFEFAEHTNIAATNELLFEKQYYLGDIMKAEDLDKATHIGESLETILGNFIKRDSNDHYTYDNFILRDHVTGMLVAWYERDENGAYKLYLKPFPIRKNYILYATTRDAPVK